MTNTCEFHFRHYWCVDDSFTEIFVIGFDAAPVLETSRKLSEWALDYFQNLDAVEEFELVEGRFYEIIGRMKVTGSTDYYGEYDEYHEVFDLIKHEVTEEQFKRCF